MVVLLSLSCGKQCVDIEDTVISNDGLYYTKQNMKLANAQICNLGGEAELKNGKRHGTWKAWYRNSNNENKEWYEHKEDPQLMFIHIYDNGKRNGTFKRWDSKGKLISEAVFKLNECISGDCDDSWREWGE